VKKLIAIALLSTVVYVSGAPAFADEGSQGQTGINNIKSGSRNVSTGWLEILDSTHAEVAKGKTPGEQLTGFVAGGAIGVRRTIHRVGAGAIDLLTFWIPKKQPLITPEKPRLE